VIGHLVFS